MSVTLEDVCREAGVSSATVSRVVNGRENVSDGTRKRVTRVMRDLKYHPDHAAQTLASKRTNTLGLIFPAIDTGYYTDLMKAVDRAAQARNYHMMISFARDREHLKELLHRFMYSKRVDGLILLNTVDDDIPFPWEPEGSTPLVIIGSPVKSFPVTTVVQDNHQAAQQVCRFLESLGCRRTLLVTGPENSHDSRERREGYMKESMQDVELLDSDFTAAGAERAMREWLLVHSAPDSVFAFNDAMALGVIRALRATGLQVPQDVRVVGYDDSAIAECIGLSSVRAPLNEIGNRATENLVDQIRTQQSSRQAVSLPGELILRETA